MREDLQNFYGAALFERIITVYARAPSSN